MAGMFSAWLLFVTVPDLYEDNQDTDATVPREAPTELARLTTATLFYVSDDGERLIGVERNVVEDDAPVEQARHVLEAQFRGVEPPLISTIPEGTLVRAVYLTDRGDAFVNLSREISSRHSGGSLSELLTIYTIVNAVTVNIPTIRRVQILIEGREVDTLAGHVDLRRPLTPREEWIDPASAEVGDITVP
jgi:spore germination protein GerM